MVNKHQRKSDQEAVDALIERAENQGYLTIEDLMAVFPEGDEDVESLSAIMLQLHREGVDIFDQESLEEIVLRSEDDTQPIRRGELQQVKSDDTVGLYLKEMSRVALLSLEEELL